MTNSTGSIHYNKAFSLMIVTVAYVISLAAAMFSVTLTKGKFVHPLWDLLIADSVATVVIFIFSRIFKNSSMYDAYWSVAPPVIVFFWLDYARPDTDFFRTLLVFMAVSLWAIRLTLNWARHWKGMRMEDWRYGVLKKPGGFGAIMTDFWGIHYFPTIMVYLGCLPLYPALTKGGVPTSSLDLVAFTICVVAVVIELVADEQLLLFKKRINDRTEFMKSGIWKYSRHPNYFGEFLFWVGIWMFGLSADPSLWWTASGLLALFLMFNFASIPMMDKRMCESRPEYADHMKKVSGFFFLPHRK